jgi:hypothetical protein
LRETEHLDVEQFERYTDAARRWPSSSTSGDVSPELSAARRSVDDGRRERDSAPFHQKA